LIDNADNLFIDADATNKRLIEIGDYIIKTLFEQFRSRFDKFWGDVFNIGKPFTKIVKNYKVTLWDLGYEKSLAIRDLVIFKSARKKVNRVLRNRFLSLNFEFFGDDDFSRANNLARKKRIYFESDNRKNPVSSV
jgi:hypothetical protein